MLKGSAVLLRADPRWAYGCVALGLLLGCGASSHGATSSANDAGPDAGDPSDYKEPPKSCSMTCPVDACAENTTPYACPALADWGTLPHADTCAAWDGTYPTPTPTKCAATGATADAAKYAGPIPTTRRSQSSPTDAA